MRQYTAKKVVVHKLGTALEMDQVHFQFLCTTWKLTKKVLTATNFWKSLGNYLEMGSAQALGNLVH